MTFRISSAYRRLIALLLPAVLLCMWAACMSVCAEITGHTTSETAAVSTFDDCSESVGQSSGSDGCQFTVTPAALQDRQTIAAPALANAETSFPPAFKPSFVPSVIKSDINQNSPPKITAPIFLRLHAFRI